MSKCRQRFLFSTFRQWLSLRWYCDLNVIAFWIWDWVLPMSFSIQSKSGATKKVPQTLFIIIASRASTKTKANLHSINEFHFYSNNFQSGLIKAFFSTPLEQKLGFDLPTIEIHLDFWRHIKFSNLQGLIGKFSPFWGVNRPLTLLSLLERIKSVSAKS